MHDAALTLADLHWQEVSTLAPDASRRRFYDAILDFGCWRTRVDLRALHPRMAAFWPDPAGTPLLVAGKAAGPNRDALALARAVMAALPDLLSPLLCLGEGFELGEWTLMSLWFPFQTHGARWYASFATQDDGQESFGFVSRSGDLRDTTFERTSDHLNALVAAPFNIRHCVEQLQQAAVTGPAFGDVLERIRSEELFGPELAPQLNAVLGLAGSQLQPYLAAHLKTMLDRVPAPGNDPSLRAGTDGK